MEYLIAKDLYPTASNMKSIEGNILTSKYRASRYSYILHVYDVLK